jgi:hypothetical protein
MQLHYLSGVPTRKGLSPLVVGTFLPANARVVSCRVVPHATDACVARVVGIIKSLGEEHLQLSALKIKQKKWIDKGAEEDVFSVKWKISGVRAPSPARLGWVDRCSRQLIITVVVVVVRAVCEEEVAR